MLNGVGLWADLHDRVNNDVYFPVNAGPPLSGPAPYGTGANICGPGSILTDFTNLIAYINEGTKASPYWSPLDYDTHNLLCWWSHFVDGSGKALADTAALATLTGSGIRIFGDGISATDSGLVVAQGAGVPVATLTASAANAKVAALSAGLTVTTPYSPTTNGTIVIDCTLTMVTALTFRRFFIGFLGTSADALVSPCTGTTATITNVQSDMAGIMFDVGLTLATTLFLTHNKANDTPTISTTLAANVDPNTGVAATIPAVGTYVRLRVECDTLGNVAFFYDKRQIGRFALGLTPATLLAPTVLIASTSAAVKSMAIKRIAMWGKKA